MTEGSVFQIVYCSKAVAGLGEQELAAILSSSRTSNEKQDVTGMLLLRQGVFVQLLEGPTDAVRGTYRRIVQDHRHTDIQLLLQGYAERRLFSVWSMAAIDHAAADACFDEKLLPILQDLQSASMNADERHRTIMQTLTTFRHGLKSSA